MRQRPSQVWTDSLRRTTAVAAAALVLALTLFSASPSAHLWLHADCDAETSGHADAAEGDHVCAITLFAAGVDFAVGPQALTPPTVVIEGIAAITAAECFLVSPRYLRQPERGPPNQRES